MLRKFLKKLNKKVIFNYLYVHDSIGIVLF